MGSGERFQICLTSFLGIGVGVSRFPFALTIDVHVLVWHASIGFGKAYDE